MMELALENSDLQPRKIVGDTLGEAVSAWVRHRFPRDTAKHLARATGLDPKTAQNIVIARHVSAPSLTKLIRAFGWPFWSDIGAAITRETHDEWVIREIEEIHHAQRRLEDQRAERAALLEAIRARRAVERGGLRLVAEDARGAVGFEGRAAGAVGSDPHPR